MDGVNTRKYTDLKEQSIYLTNFKGVIDSKTFIMMQERLENNEQIAPYQSTLNALCNLDVAHTNWGDFYFIWTLKND